MFSNTEFVPVAATTTSHDGGNWMWAIILFFGLLVFGAGGFFNNGNRGASSGGGAEMAATVAMMSAANNNSRSIASDYTDSAVQAGFNNAAVIGKLDRLGDGLSSGFYAQNTNYLTGLNAIQRDMCTGFASNESAINQARFEAQQCCCETEKEILQSRFNSAQEACEIIRANDSNTQKILDAISGNRIADMQNQINYLQLQSALCGVVRYPSATTFSAGYNPYFGGIATNNGCGCA